MTNPTWLAATSGQLGQAGQVNQFLVSHDGQYLYDGTVEFDQSVAGSLGVHSNGTYIAEQWTSGASQTTVGRVVLELATAGTPTAALTVELRASLTGAALASALVPQEFLSGAYLALSVPLPALVSSSTTYYVVTTAEGDASNYFSWGKNDQASGGWTSPDGATWTAQSYGLRTQVYDQSVTGFLRHSYEDSGARWVGLDWTSGEITTVREYTTGQSSSGYAASSRTLAYTQGQLTAVG